MAASSGPEAGPFCPAPAWREEDRLAALQGYRILDTGREAAFDEVAELAADLLDAPMAVVNLIAADRQWFKAEVGIGTDSLPLDVSICRHAILQPGVMVVPDLRDDPRFEGNPLIHVEGGLRFYAGALLATPDGLPLGTVCVLDREPRPEGITARQRRALAVLASQTMAQIELRRAKEEAQAAARRQSFLLTLEERLRSLGDPREVMEAASEMLARHLDALRAGYGEIEPGGEFGTIERDWTAEGAPPLKGRHRIDSFGPGLVAELRAGHTVMIADLSDDPRTAGPATAAAYAAIGARASINVPLVKNGRFAAVLYVHASEPRHWSDEEAALVREVAERTWSALERARVEAALRESEDHHRHAVELDPQTTWTAAPDGQLDRVNARWKEWTGTTGLGSSYLGALHPDDRARTTEAWTRSVATGEPYDIEHRLLTLEGEVRWIHSRAYPRRDKEGRIVRWYGSTEDIHDRRVAEERLRASEERYRQIVEGAEDFAIVTLDEGGRITGWNSGAERILGYTEDEVIGQPGAIIFLPEDREHGAADREMNQASSQGRAVNERWHLRRDGSRFWGSGLMMHLDGGGFLKIFRDRTAEHEAEAALRATSRRLDAILANTREAVFLMDERQQCVFANAAAEKLTGYSLDHMKGRPLHDVVHHKRPDGSHYPLEECPIDRAFPERAQMSGEELFVAPDGSFYPVAFTASPVLDHEGRPIGTVIEARNISDEKAANERLAQLAAVTEQSRDFIGVADARGRPVYVNEAGRAMVGLPSLEAACAVGLLDYFAPKDRETIRTQALTAADTEGYWEGEVAFRRFDDGREFPVLYNIFPVRNSAGETTHYATVTRDLTEKRNVEAELRHLNATLEARVEERTRGLMAAEEQLRQAQKMEAVGQLTGGLAHDFNNLLAGISGSLELMGTRIAQGRVADVERYLLAAQGAAKRAAALTHRLLAFSRRQTLEPKATDVNRLVAGMEELIGRTVGPAVSVATVAKAGLWTTLVDPHQLESALLNLCINARDAMPGGGRIVVETGNCWLDERAARERDLPPGQYVSLCVSDNGTGMPPEVVEKAFDPFFTTKPIGQGTGLGLSMIYGFARQSGGQVRIYSEMDQGTMVCLYLPRHHGQEVAEVALPSPAAEPAGGGTGGTVLVVDDELTVRMLVADMVEELGFQAVEAGTGSEGLEVLRSDTRVDLLVTDVGLPGGMNGRQVAEAARNLRPGLKVLFITGYAENAVLSHGHLEPGMQVVTKPFDMARLASRIREMVGTE